MRRKINHADVLLSLPLPMLSAADLDRQRLLDNWYGQLAQIAIQIAASRAALKTRQDEQNRALKNSASMPASRLYELAKQIDEMEAETAEKVRPVIDAFTAIRDKYGEKPDPDKIDRAIHRYSEEGLDIAISWLELIQNYQIECLKLASEKGGHYPIISSADELEREFHSILKE